MLSLQNRYCDQTRSNAFWHAQARTHTHARTHIDIFRKSIGSFNSRSFKGFVSVMFWLSQRFNTRRKCTVWIAGDSSFSSIKDRCHLWCCHCAGCVCDRGFIYLPLLFCSLCLLVRSPGQLEDFFPWAAIREMDKNAGLWLAAAHQGELVPERLPHLVHVSVSVTGCSCGTPSMWQLREPAALSCADVKAGHLDCKHHWIPLQFLWKIVYNYW